MPDRPWYEIDPTSSPSAQPDEPTDPSHTGAQSSPARELDPATAPPPSAPKEAIILPATQHSQPQEPDVEPVETADLDPEPAPEDLEHPEPPATTPSTDPPQSQTLDAEAEPALVEPESDLEASDESLDDALNSLERMLDRQAELPLGSPNGDATEGADADFAAEPQTLPVLENVVIPGRGPITPESVSATGFLAGLTPGGLLGQPISDLEAEAPSEAALRRRVAARLASEIDIIVQSKLESMLERLYVDLRAQIADHIDIMLPEIIDEFVRHEVGDSADDVDDQE